LQKYKDLILKTIFITGGAGFVGSNLAIKFKKDNPCHCVISLDNLKRRGSEININRLKQAGVIFVYGDVRNKDDIFQAIKFCPQKPNVFIECSAEPSVLAGLKESPAYIINTNLMGTINCIEAARQTGADFVFISTSRVYPIKPLTKISFDELPHRFSISKNQNIVGVNEKGISESFTLEGTRSLYGATKLASEIIIQEYVETYDIMGIINRCGVIAGPWQMGKDDQGIISFWVAKHFFGGKLSYIGFGGKGKQVRDVLHIDDLYSLLKIQLSNIKKYNGKVYNVGGGMENSVSLKELTQICQNVTNNKINISEDEKERELDIPFYVTDYSKIMNESGWKPKKSVLNTVTDVYNWLVRNKNIIKDIFVV
jgi:CDP-paratose 2-epimerase